MYEALYPLVQNRLIELDSAIVEPFIDEVCDYVQTVSDVDSILKLFFRCMDLCPTIELMNKIHETLAILYRGNENLIKEKFNYIVKRMINNPHVYKTIEDVDKNKAHVLPILYILLLEKFLDKHFPKELNVSTLSKETMIGYYNVLQSLNPEQYTYSTHYLEIINLYFDTLKIQNKTPEDYMDEINKLSGEV